jgi:ribosomal protein L11 methyltransferase
LEREGARAVTLEAASDQAIFDGVGGEAGFWEHTHVTALLDLGTEEIEPFLDSVALAFAPELLPTYALSPLEDRDWTRSWMDRFVPMRFGKKLWVHPSWIAPLDPEGINIMLDPGMAFGTGTHPTTALCLEWLANCRVLSGARVVDYGCGSGILALAAAKLGARQVWAVDLDARALAVTCDNAAKNEVLDTIIPLLPEHVGHPQPVDIVIANILAGPLLELAPRFAKLTVIGGRVVLSGILAEQAEECLAAYASWFTMDQLERREEWCLLAGARRHGVDCPPLCSVSRGPC